MKERIRQLRRHLDLTQQQFADALGIKRNTIANYESGRNAPVDSVLSLICKEFNVNEDWLRNGTGEMFLPESQDEIDQLTKRYNLEPAIQIFIKKLVSLPPEQRKIVSALIMDTALEVSQIEDQEEEDSIDQQVEAYRRALEMEKRSKGKIRSLLIYRIEKEL